MNFNTKIIWQRFSDGLKLFILKRVKDEHDAEDILQDVFAKIHGNLPSLKGQEKVGAWVYQIARNTIIDYYRRRYRTVDISEIPEIISEEAPDEETGDEVVLCLKPMIDDLPERYRQAITLTEYDGLSQMELSEQLGISISGAKSRVQRARSRLKDSLLQCCHFEFDRRGQIIDYEIKEQACLYCSEDQVTQ